MQDIISDERGAPEGFYAGCYARAAITAFGYDRKGNKGVSFSLMHIQKVKDGEPFGADRGKPDDFFNKEKSGADNAENYTKVNQGILD